MKKILLTAIFTAMTLLVLVSCTTDEPAEVTPNDIIIIEPDEGNTVESAVASYYSLLFDEGGFGTYLEAFPKEFVAGYQVELEYDDAVFQEAIDNTTYSLHATRDEKYGGYEYYMEYNYVSQRELSYEEKAPIIKDLKDYCYMKKSSIEKVVEYTYEVYSCGVDPVTGNAIYPEESTDKITMLYISGEGWYVSPTNFQLP